MHAYHGAGAESSSRNATNVPILVTVAQNNDQVVVVCRTLSIANLSVSVVDKQIVFTLYNSTKEENAALVPSGFRVVGADEINKPKQWTRTISLPCAVVLDSQQTKQIDGNAIIFTFSKAP